ncbi:hypothetical protein SFR_2595 [Streptomyces sp. FR-008]|nr:hypothetical protein SFR_2595 [Streptomyces sp. FR-008]
MGGVGGNALTMHAEQRADRKSRGAPPQRRPPIRFASRSEGGQHLAPVRGRAGRDRKAPVRTAHPHGHRPLVPHAFGRTGGQIPDGGDILPAGKLRPRAVFTRAVPRRPHVGPARQHATPLAFALRPCAQKLQRHLPRLRFLLGESHQAALAPLGVEDDPLPVGDHLADDAPGGFRRGDIHSREGITRHIDLGQSRQLAGIGSTGGTDRFRLGRRTSRTRQTQRDTGGQEPHHPGHQLPSDLVALIPSTG